MTLKDYEHYIQIIKEQGVNDRYGIVFGLVSGAPTSKEITQGAVSFVLSLGNPQILRR